MIKYPSKKCWYCGEGWYFLIEEMILQLAILLEDRFMEIVDFKEKFGRLSVCVSDLPSTENKKIYHTIFKYEDLSCNFCERCGCKGIRRTDLECIGTLCDKHYEEELKNEANFL